MDHLGDSAKINWRDRIGNIGSKAYDLFKLYNKVIFELKELGVIRSKNNPVGDYGEFLAEKIFGLTRAVKDSKGYDLLDTEGKKYQVKTRRPTPDNLSRQLGGFRDLDEKLFDSCLAIILSPDFEPKEIWEIPHAIISRYARDTTRGFKRVILDGKILREDGVKQHL